MKTTTELFAIMSRATESSMKSHARNEAGVSTYAHNTWFFSYSGHVNSLDATMYPLGWNQDTNHQGINPIKLSSTLDKAGIQLMYWFIFNNLTATDQLAEQKLSDLNDEIAMNQLRNS